MINLAATFEIVGRFLQLRAERDGLKNQLADVRRALDYDLKAAGISPVIADPAAVVLYRSNMRAFKAAVGIA